MMLTPLQLAYQELQASAIDESLIGVAVDIAPDIEIDSITREVIATPLDDALDKRYTRFGHSTKANEAGIIFRNEDGSVWQVKRGIGRNNNNGRSGRYLAPGGIGNAIYLPAISDQVLAKICDRHDLNLATVQAEIAAIGSFWGWVKANKQLPIIPTEGAKKALAALSEGRIAIALYGCTCGRSEALKPFLADRQIIAAFDQDAKPKASKAVAMGHYILSSAVREAGGTLTIAHWHPEQGKGLDDLIAQSGVEAFHQAIEHPESFDLWVARRAVRSRLGHYADRPNMRVNVPCLGTAIAPESIPESGIVGIVGGAGTGKSKLLAALTVLVYAALAPLFRISLSRGLCERLALTYIKDADRGNGYLMDANGQPTRKLGLVFDSLLSVPLWLYEDGSFDLILDEADQGFKHLISGGTCGKDGKRPALVQHTIKLIKRAKRVILASATLTRHELDLVAQLRGETPWILINDYKANSYPIEFYTGQRGVKGSGSKEVAMVICRMIEAIKQGKRIIVPTDQLRICRMVERIALSQGLLPHQVLRFDRHTSPEDLQREFADHPDDFLDRHDIRLLTHSPSLTSGVSIEGDHFDLCVGIFTGQTISPDDALQALARVRKPIPRVVYASHWGKGSSAIHATRKADYLERSHQRTKMIGKVLEQDFTGSPDDPIAEYHAATQAERNQAMMNFGASLQALLEHAGHQLTHGAIDDEAATVAAGLWKAAGKAISELAYVEEHSAGFIDAAEAANLRGKKNLKHADALKLFRHDLADWYGIDQYELTLEDVKFDRHGRTRQQLSRLEWLLWDGLARSKDSADLDRLTSHNAPITQHDLPGRELFTRSAQVFGVADLLMRCIENEWHAGTDWVQKFSEKVRQYAADARLACGFRIHDKLTDCQIVGMVLGTFGLSTDATQRRTPDGRIRVYQLDKESLSIVKGILQRRAQRHMEKGLKPVTHPLISLLLEGVCHPKPDTDSPVKLTPKIAIGALAPPPA